MKYDGHIGIGEHIMKMSDMTSQSEDFFARFIMTSLSS